MRYCKRCVYPEVAVNVIFDDEGVCSACRVAEEFSKLSPEFWKEREKRFRQIVESHRREQGDNYDCIIIQDICENLQVDPNLIFTETDYQQVSAAALNPY